MKTVFSKTADVCAIWAAQSQDHARTGSNTSFRGNTLMSYGVPIATLVRATAGTRTTVALLTTRKYSDTTSVVQGQAKAAAENAGLAHFTVPNMAADKEAIAANIDHFTYLVGATLNHVENARKPEGWRMEAKALIATADAFSRAFRGRPFEWAGPDPDTVLSKKEREA